MTTKSFSQRLRAGATPEELKAHYCISEDQYQRVVSCLQEIKSGGKQCLR